MFTLRLQLCLLLLQFLSHVHGQLSDLRRCADPQCQKVIAEAHTTMKYISGHRGVLSFRNNAVAKIYSKDAGSNLDWWGVEIDGKRAYAPKKFLREDRVLVPDKLLQHVVPVEESSLIFSNAKNINANNEKIDKIENVKLSESLIDDEDEEADGGEEFLDEDDEEDEEPEGIQVYNAGANSPSNPEQEKSALTEETATGQPSLAEAKPGEHSTASVEISSSSAKDPSANVSPSTVDFEVVDGTTIFGDPVDTTLTPPYLPDYETAPPLYASTTNTVQTTTATPALSPSKHTVSTMPEVGRDGSTTPELQVVPSGLPMSSLASREAPVSATPASVLDEGAAASIAHVSNSVETSSSDTVNSQTAPSSDVMNPEAVSVSEEGAGITTTKSEVADDNQENSGENKIHNVNNSDSKLNSETPALEVNEAGNAAGSEESNLPSTGDGSLAVERKFVPFSPIFKKDSPPAELNTDYIVEEVRHDGDSIAKSNSIHDQAGDGGTSKHASIALQSDNPVGDAEGTNPELTENSSNVPEDGAGSIFDGWLSGWSSAEDDSGTDVEASEEPSKESSSQSQPGEQSEVGDVASSGDGAVDDLTNSVGEVSFISAADRVTANEQSTSFETTTEEVAATVAEGAAIGGTEVLQENAGSHKTSAALEDPNAQREQRKKKIRKNIVHALKMSASRTLSPTRKRTKDMMEKTSVVEPSSVQPSVSGSASASVMSDAAEAGTKYPGTKELQSSMSQLPSHSDHSIVQKSTPLASNQKPLQSEVFEGKQRQTESIHSTAIIKEVSQVSGSKSYSTSGALTQNASLEESLAMKVHQKSSSDSFTSFTNNSVHHKVAPNRTMSHFSTFDPSLSHSTSSTQQESVTEHSSSKSQYSSSLFHEHMNAGSKPGDMLAKKNKPEIHPHPQVHAVDHVPKDVNISDSPKPLTSAKKDSKQSAPHIEPEVPHASAVAPDSTKSPQLVDASESIASYQSGQKAVGHSDVGEAVRGSESASDFVTTGGSLDGEPLENFVSSSPIPELRDEQDFGKEKLGVFLSETENVNVVTESSVIHASQPPADASVPHTGISEPTTETSGLVTDDSEPIMNGVSQPTTGASQFVTDASELVTGASQFVTDASESVTDASEHLTDSSTSISGDSVLESPMADPMLEMPNSADQLVPGEMVSSSSGEQHADVFDAITDPSGDTSGPAQVEGDEASPEAPDMLTSESAGDGSDLHDPESLTGHLLKTVEPILGESLSLALEHDLSSPVASSGAVAAVVVLALTILLLYVASALITKCSREGPLLKALNVLEHEQHTAEQLIADLQRKLAAGHVQTGSLAESSEAAQVLAQQLQQAQEENMALVERVQDLEQQLEESTSSGLEMDNMLQELLLSQKDTTSFQEAIDSLQQMLDSQREKVESLTADLSIKTTLNEELRGESATAKERIRKLEYQLDQVTQSLEEVNSAKAQVVAQLAAEQGRLQHVTEERDVLARSSSDASTALATLTEQHSGVQTKAQQLRSTLKTKEAELQVTKECLKQLKVFNNDGKAAKEKLAQLLDSVKARSELACVVEERRTLEADLQQRSEQVAQLERRVQQAQEEAELCRKDQATADQEKREALSKLAVLTDYFHEKEAQLTKELESESGLRLDAEGSAESITSRMRDYDMQLLAYKTQVNTLKKELEDQELSFKTQLAAQEQKAHESWVSARAAERKYEESKQETAQMRSRLLLMSKDNSDQHAIIKPAPQHAETSNGSVSSPRPPLHDDLDGEHSHPLDSPPPIPPPHMLPHLFPPPPNLPPGMPPPFPPPHFLPPPLPPPMMADRRLPPAGRLASPPFHRRMGAASPPEFLDRRSPPHFDRRSYSPASSRYSDRQGRYSPDRHGRYSPDRHGRYSPDRHGRYSPDRQGRFSPGRYSPDRHSDRMYDRHHHHNDRYNNIDRHSDAYSSNGRNDSQRESSPERPYNRSPEGFARKASPPPLHRRLYDEGGGPPTRKGKKTSTPVGPNDR